MLIRPPAFGRIVVLGVAIVLVGCGQRRVAMDDMQRKQVATSVERAMHSFEQAERARDAEALIAHFAAVPEFHIYSDGTRLSYDEMASYIRSTFPTLRSIEGGFVDLNVMVLAPDAALAAGTFREGTTDASGKTTRVRGAASWLWRQIDGRWLIVYGHADHYPDAGS
jgi:ketosteroid isomerase-like protein